MDLLNYKSQLVVVRCQGMLEVVVLCHQLETTVLVYADSSQTYKSIGSDR